LIFRGLNFESNEELGQKCHLWLDTSLGAEKKRVRLEERQQAVSGIFHEDRLMHITRS